MGFAYTDDRSGHPTSLVVEIRDDGAAVFRIGDAGIVVPEGAVRALLMWLDVYYGRSEELA